MNNWVFCVMITRIGITVSLSGYDFIMHKDFHQMYIADEGNLEETFLNKMIIDKSKLRKTSTVSEGSDTFRIKIDEKIVLKISKEGKSERKFIAIVQTGMKEEISTVEKSYGDFKAFRNGLEYQLRDSGITPPQLQRMIFDILMPSSDEIFK